MIFFHLLVHIVTILILVYRFLGMNNRTLYLVRWALFLFISAELFVAFSPIAWVLPLIQEPSISWASVLRDLVICFSLYATNRAWHNGAPRYLQKKR